VVRFVGSEEAVNAADRLFSLMMREMESIVNQTEVNVRAINAALMEFQTVCRQDLGHPNP
jgi:hypothetical protein